MMTGITNGSEKLELDTIGLLWKPESDGDNEWMNEWIAMAKLSAMGFVMKLATLPT